MWKKESLVVQRAVKGPRTRGLILKLTKDILELMMEAKKKLRSYYVFNGSFETYKRCYE